MEAHCKCAHYGNVGTVPVADTTWKQLLRRDRECNRRAVHANAGRDNVNPTARTGDILKSAAACFLVVKREPIPCIQYQS